MREIDLRDFSYRPADHRAVTLEAAVEVASRGLAGAHSVRAARVSHPTGTPAVLASRHAGPAVGSPPDEARNHLRRVSVALGFDHPSRAEFVPEAAAPRTSTGARVVHLQQYHRGIPFFEMVRTVRLSPEGVVQEVVGDNVAIGEGWAIDVEPTIEAAEAVHRALAHLGRAEAESASRRDHHGQASGRQPALRTGTRLGARRAFALPSRPAQFEVAGLDEPVAAQLVLLHLNPAIQLGWLVAVFLPDLAGDYDLVVAANGERVGELLYCKNTLPMAAARGEVFRHDPGESGRERVDFPPTGDPLLPDLPPPARDWVAADRTIGNNVAVFRGNSRMSLTGASRGGTVAFTPTDPDGKDQRLLNAFYHCNFLHDFFLAQGFDERAGNFQAENFTGVPGGSDELEVRIRDRVISGTARMRARRDGRNPEMLLGLAASTGRHTALDGDVVRHEYVHGVTLRLVGGSQNFAPLVQPQSRAMGEGWSDYFALTIQNFDRPEERLVYGVWSSGLPQGTRPRAGTYGDDFPGHFGRLGDRDFSEAHDAGEIWCAALMRMNRLVGEALGDRRRGHRLCWQLVVDSLKLIAPSPSFLDGRDGILEALDDMRDTGALEGAIHAAVRDAIQAAFSQLGMGPGADSSGASFENIVTDFG